MTVKWEDPRHMTGCSQEQREELIDHALEDLQKSGRDWSYATTGDSIAIVFRDKGGYTEVYDCLIRRWGEVK